MKLPNCPGLLLSLVLPLAACSATIHLDQSWSSWAWLGTEPCNEAKTLTADCAAAATRVDGHLRVHGSSGSLVLRIVDPNGVERHHQTVHGGSCEVSQRWPAIAGTWKLRVEPADFVGNYAVELTAGDEPITVRVDVAGDTPR